MMVKKHITQVFLYTHTNTLVSRGHPVLGLNMDLLCTDLFETESVGQDPVHGVGLHLSPLQLEAVDSGSVLPQSAVRVVVKLWSVGFS